MRPIHVHETGGDRRPAAAPAVACDAGRRDRHRHVGAGHIDREYRTAHHRARPACDSGRLDLGGERLPTRGDGDAAAVRLDRRHIRPSARLCVGPAGLHRGVVRVRGGAVAAGAGDRPRAPGFRRRRHHERQRRAGALHLSARGAWPRHRLQRAGGRRVVHRRPVGRGGDHVGAVLALAVRIAGARRHRRAVDGAPLPAANAARRPPIRSAERGAERDHIRPVHHRARRHRARPGSGHGTDRARGQHRGRLVLRASPVHAGRTDAAGRSVPPAGVRALGGDRDMRARRTAHRLRRIAVLLPVRQRPVADRDRRADHTVARRTGGDGADRRPPGGPVSRRDCSADSAWR